jgi:hypothetical protein
MTVNIFKLLYWLINTCFVQKSGRKQGKQGAGQEGISFKLEMAQCPQEVDLSS